jgi:hypothetical protein
MGQRSLGTLLVFSCLALRFGATAGEPPSPAAADFFEKEVRPILIQRCGACHAGSKTKGGLKLTSRAAVLEGGAHGPAAVAAKPDDSLLVRAIRYREKRRMPPRQKLPDHEIQVLTRWVEQGLPWPESPAGIVNTGAGFEISAAQRRFWSFQPVRDPVVPAVRDTAWPLSPVDRFILAKLEERGLAPAAPADRRTLLRRATFDLTGLPPTPEELEAFVADPSPDAFARVVDRLLASQHYGERWGRHWLDVAHYADTAGETADFPVPQAYRYRNYVINAFNHDKPYDQFIQEQIAGDILAQKGPSEKYAERVIATGYLAISRRFGYDPQNYHHLTLEDTIDTVGRSILGLTLACARCHDHKFDPISRADYYGLYGIFASTLYPFPGSEENKKQHDFVPLAPPELRTASTERAYAVWEGIGRDAPIQKRGDPTTLGEVVPRHFPAILGDFMAPPDTAESGRLQLARWLTDPHNPLTARVMVNRIWQHHFSQGLVRTPSNFGKQGRPPTHPELLDYLAARFVEGQWSIKKMHRLIMLSRTYQMASPHDRHGADVDPDNLWLSHFERQRLDAESIRDALLFVGGRLDRSMGGPHPFPPQNQWGFTQHAPFQAVYETNRRSVYLMTQRIRRHSFLALFDGADPNSSTAGRTVTTVPTQALFFMNNSLVHEQATHLADRLLREQTTDCGRVRLAYLLALGRPPTAEEQRQAELYVQEFSAEWKRAGTPAAQPAVLAWASFARILYSSNEFVYVD